MAGNVPPRIVEPITTAQHFTPPSARELRAQAVHRLQVGVFGLSAMLLIVGLANIIMDRARLTDVREPVEEVIAADAQPKKTGSEPLADIGVVPSADPTPEIGATPVQPTASFAP
ncbi:hypothetical protein [Novosphingobium sp. M1R2S20]|uniref:Energy transducer TonB n=1 Tax=Novosphingobium rhizovicinum TaxID=3228928 RepID=A0ABV3R881_9SPHN